MRTSTSPAQAGIRQNISRIIRFRKDLYHNLDRFAVTIPPLRERAEDIPMLVWMFVRDFEKKIGRRIESIPDRIVAEFQQYIWHGNVRERRHIIEHAMIITVGTILQSHLPAVLSENSVEIATHTC